MRLYFKRYEKNIEKVYDMTEFYNRDGSMKVDGLEYVDQNFKADDGITSVVVRFGEIYDPVNKEQNFLLVPSVGKIYRIDGYLYVNYDDVEIMLTEDYLLSNYTKVREFNYHATRAFPYDKNGEPLLDYNIVNNYSMERFPTVGHDIDRIIRGTTYRYTKLKEGSSTKFALLFFKVDGSENIEIKVRSKTNSASETFYSDPEIYAKYPNVQLDSSFGPPEYTDKLVKVDYEEGGWDLFRYVDGYGWNRFDEEGYFEDRTIKTSGLHKSQNEIDVDTVIMAMPFSEIGVKQCLTFNQFVRPTLYDGEKRNATLMDIKIVDSNFLNLDLEPDQDGILQIQNMGESWLQSVNLREPGKDPYPVFFLEGHKKEINISKYLADLNGISGYDRYLSSVDSIEPFKEYYFNFYGNRHQISAFKTSLVKLIVSVTSEAISYQIVETHGSYVQRHSDKVVLYEGILSNSAFFTTNEKDEFYAQNPLFKSQMNANLGANTLKSIASGAGSGAMTGTMLGGPGPGTAIGAGIGALVGAVGAGVDAAFTHHNKNLSDRTMAMRDNPIRGDLSQGLDIATSTHYGMYWITYDNYVGKREMKLGYYMRGMPISKYLKIKDSYMNDPGNTLFDDEKYMYVCGNIINETGGLRTVAQGSIRETIARGVFIKDFKEV